MDTKTALERLSRYWDCLASELTEEQIKEIETIIYQFIKENSKESFSI